MIKAQPEIMARNARDKELLVQRFESLAPGELVPDAELTKLIGRPVMGEGYPALRSAVRHVRQDRNNADGKGIVIERVKGEGYKRATANDFPKIGAQALQKSSRAAGLGRRKLACADLENMTQKERIETTAKMGALGAIQLCATERKVKALESHVEKAANGKRLDSRKVLKLFEAG